MAHPKFVITAYNADMIGYSVAEYARLSDARRDYDEMRATQSFRKLHLDEYIQQDGIWFKHGIA